MRRVFQELKRREVFKAGIAYLIVAWVILQVTDVVVPILELPAWTARLVFFLLAIGFPIALVLAWSYDLTPDGIRRESGEARARNRHRSSSIPERLREHRARDAG